MSAARVHAATMRAQTTWSTEVAALGARAAAAALRDPSRLDEIVAVVGAVVRGNTPHAARAGASIIADTVQAAGLPRPRDLADPDVPVADVPAAVLRAWQKARAAAQQDEHVHEPFLRAELARIVADSLTDAMRDGSHAQMAADRRIIGWRRVSRSGCCGACLALTTGRTMAVDERLATHTRCRCVAEPVIRGVNEHRTPFPTGAQRWQAMTAEQQDAMFHGHGGARKADLVRSGAARLEDLVAREPRGPGMRPFAREATLTELQPA